MEQYNAIQQHVATVFHFFLPNLNPEWPVSRYSRFLLPEIQLNRFSHYWFPLGKENIMQPMAAGLFKYMHVALSRYIITGHQHGFQFIFSRLFNCDCHRCVFHVRMKWNSGRLRVVSRRRGTLDGVCVSVYVFCHQFFFPTPTIRCCCGRKADFLCVARF